MTTYLRPGVFITESLTPLVDNTTSDSTAVAAFVGINDYLGPTTPTLVSSWSQFQQQFGSIKVNQSDLAFGVYNYFNNGGNYAYIVRAVAPTATVAASLVVNDTQGSPAPTLTITANSVGTWANSGGKGPGVFITIAPTTAKDMFDLTVELGQGANVIARETFTGLSLDPTSARNAVTIINGPVSGSKYITVA